MSWAKWAPVCALRCPAATSHDCRCRCCRCCAHPLLLLPPSFPPSLPPLLSHLQCDTEVGNEGCHGGQQHGDDPAELHRGGGGRDSGSAASRSDPIQCSLANLDTQYQSTRIHKRYVRCATDRLNRSEATQKGKRSEAAVWLSVRCLFFSSSSPSCCSRLSVVRVYVCVLYVSASWVVGGVRLWSLIAADRQWMGGVGGPVERLAEGQKDARKSEKSITRHTTDSHTIATS